MIEKLGITPGPWKARSRDQTIYGPAGVSIAFFGDNGIYGDESYSISKKEAYANTRLGAASPEMLEALYKTSCTLEKWFNGEKVTLDVKVMVDAIEKATGLPWAEVKERIG